MEDSSTPAINHQLHHDDVFHDVPLFVRGGNARTIEKCYIFVRDDVDIARDDTGRAIIYVGHDIQRRFRVSVDKELERGLELLERRQHEYAERAIVDPSDEAAFVQAQLTALMHQVQTDVAEATDVFPEAAAIAAAGVVMPWLAPLNCLNGFLEREASGVDHLVAHRAEVSRSASGQLRLEERFTPVSQNQNSMATGPSAAQHPVDVDQETSDRNPSIPPIPYSGIAELEEALRLREEARSKQEREDDARQEEQHQRERNQAEAAIAQARKQLDELEALRQRQIAHVSANRKRQREEDEEKAETIRNVVEYHESQRRIEEMEKRLEALEASYMQDEQKRDELMQLLPY